jgi:cytidylate kinase
VLRVWVEAPPDTRLARGIERDGAAQEAAWQRWSEAEAAHFESDRTKYRADVRVDGTVPIETVRSR